MLLGPCRAPGGALGALLRALGLSGALQGPTTSFGGPAGPQEVFPGPCRASKRACGALQGLRMLFGGLAGPQKVFLGPCRAPKPQLRQTWRGVWATPGAGLSSLLRDKYRPIALQHNCLFGGLQGRPQATPVRTSHVPWSVFGAWQGPKRLLFGPCRACKAQKTYLFLAGQAKTHSLGPGPGVMFWGLQRPKRRSWWFWGSFLVCWALHGPLLGFWGFGPLEGPQKLVAGVCVFVVWFGVS